MIINTGMRTDIPAFYSEWFLNRIREGYVLVRNPYFPEQVAKYLLDPEVVDLLMFCTKNPEPMLQHMDPIKKFRQFWFVTITPYGKDIEPNVPDKADVMRSFQKLSQIVGYKSVSWRYDPIFLSEKYDPEFHVRIFGQMAKELQRYTDQVVISFIDLYQKTKRNFPEAREVSMDDRLYLGKTFAEIGRAYGIKIRTCAEGEYLTPYGVETSGCASKNVLERAIGLSLDVPKQSSARPACTCVLGNDIGVYNTCSHFCRYCYANYDRRTVLENQKNHDPKSPLLIGNLREDDTVRTAKQVSWLSGQMVLDL